MDAVVSCDRGVSRRVGGRGFRFSCRLSKPGDTMPRTRESAIWYDDFLQEWFVEVPESRVPVDWYAATQLSDIGDYYDD